MKTPVMKVGYILTTFPCRTETFAAGEIEGLGKLGFVITVFAATSQGHRPARSETMKVFYRPSLFSTEALLSIGYLFIRYPLALGKLLCLALRLNLYVPAGGRITDGQRPHDRLFRQAF